MSNQNQVQTVAERNISDRVLAKVNALDQSKGLVLPKDYVASNALKAAWLIIQDVVDKDKKAALEVCDSGSIANALFEMVVQGLNPVKKQCYFIVIEKRLTMRRSYFGTEALARRFGGLKKIKAQVIYEGDDFVHEINTDTGLKKILKHGQKLENIDITKIRGAYAIFETEDGTIDVEIMTKAQIIASWNMGSAKGGSPAHINFTDQMALKTVRSRACKLLINASSDAVLIKEDIGDNTAEALEERNTVDVTFEDMSPALQAAGQELPKKEQLKEQATQEPKQKVAQEEKKETAPPVVADQRISKQPNF